MFLVSPPWRTIAFKAIYKVFLALGGLIGSSLRRKRRRMRRRNRKRMRRKVVTGKDQEDNVTTSGYNWFCDIETEGYYGSGWLGRLPTGQKF